MHRNPVLVWLLELQVFQQSDRCQPWMFAPLGLAGPDDLGQERLVLFWHGVGERMGIEPLPDGLEALLNLNVRVKRRAFAPARIHLSPRRIGRESGIRGHRRDHRNDHGGIS